MSILKKNDHIKRNELTAARSITVDGNVLNYKTINKTL